MKQAAVILLDFPSLAMAISLLGEIKQCLRDAFNWLALSESSRETHIAIITNPPTIAVVPPPTNSLQEKSTLEKFDLAKLHSLLDSLQLDGVVPFTSSSELNLCQKLFQG